MKKSSGRKLLRNIQRENIRKKSRAARAADAAEGSRHKQKALRKKEKAKRKQARKQRKAA